MKAGALSAGSRPGVLSEDRSVCACPASELASAGPQPVLRPGRIWRESGLEEAEALRTLRWGHRGHWNAALRACLLPDMQLLTDGHCTPDRLLQDLPFWVQLMYPGNPIPWGDETQSKTALPLDKGEAPCQPGGACTLGCDLAGSRSHPCLSPTFCTSRSRKRCISQGTGHRLKDQTPAQQHSPCSRTQSHLCSVSCLTSAGHSPPY